MLKVRYGSLAIVAALLLALAAPVARAADKANFAGTWKWTQQGRQGGNPTEVTLKLKQDGDKVTGTVTSNFGGQPTDTAISDVTVKDNEIKFNVVREFNEQKRTTTYTGKLEGDTIKGSMERERQGEKVKTDWEAKRAKE
jgi:hypothetical protein